jgi:hypothetical protein
VRPFPPGSQNGTDAPQLILHPPLAPSRQELLSPGGELRGTSAPPSDREVFLLQFGESEETLREGRLVEAKVTRGFTDHPSSCLWVPTAP